MGWGVNPGLLHKQAAKGESQTLSGADTYHITRTRSHTDHTRRLAPQAGHALATRTHAVYLVGRASQAP